MHVTLRGLVIRSIDYKDASKILTVLTDELGRVTVSAPGARSKSVTARPAAQLFAYSEMTLFENRGRYNLNEADTIEQFTGLAKDLDKMALACYLADVLGTEVEGNRIDPDVLRLALNSLYALSRGKAGPDKIKAAFELRYAALCGYQPDLSRCNLCGAQPEEPVVRLESGLLHCLACGGAGPGLDAALDTSALAAARYILACDLKRLFSFSLPISSMRLLGDFAERYLLCRLERGFKTLDFYRMACLSCGPSPETGPHQAAAQEGENRF